MRAGSDMQRGESLCGRLAEHLPATAVVGVAQRLRQSSAPSLPLEVEAATGPTADGRTGNSSRWSDACHKAPNLVVAVATAAAGACACADSGMSHATHV